MTPYRNWNGSQKDATFQRSYASGIPFFKLSFVEIVQDPIGVTIATNLGFNQPNSPIENQYEINGKKLGSMLLFISRTIFQTIQIHDFPGSSKQMLNVHFFHPCYPCYPSHNKKWSMCAMVN